MAGRAAAPVARALVVEVDGLPGLGGVPEHVERRLVGAQPRLDDVEAPRVELEPGRGELARPRRWSPRPAGRAPRPGSPGRPRRPRRRPGGCRAGRTRRAGCGSRARRRSSGSMLPTSIGTPRLRSSSLSRSNIFSKASVAESGYRIVADPLLGDVVALDQQHDQQVEQPLALPARRCLACSMAVMPAGPVSPRPRMSTTKYSVSVPLMPASLLPSLP